MRWKELVKKYYVIIGKNNIQIFFQYIAKVVTKIKFIFYIAKNQFSKTRNLELLVTLVKLSRKYWWNINICLEVRRIQSLSPRQYLEEFLGILLRLLTKYIKILLTIFSFLLFCIKINIRSITTNFRTKKCGFS